MILGYYLILLVDLLQLGAYDLDCKSAATSPGSRGTTRGPTTITKRDLVKPWGFTGRAKKIKTSILLGGSSRNQLELDFGL